MHNLTFGAGVSLAVGAFITLATGLASKLVGEELRTRLESLPGGLVKLAILLNTPELREELYDEYHSELLFIVRNTKGKPVTRLLKGLRYAAGLIVAAPRVNSILKPLKRETNPRAAATIHLEKAVNLKWNGEVLDAIEVARFEDHVQVTKRARNTVSILRYDLEKWEIIKRDGASPPE